MLKSNTWLTILRRRSERLTHLLRVRRARVTGSVARVAHQFDNSAKPPSRFKLLTTAPAEAYGLSSALYQAPEGEPLAFAGYTSTDIPQVGGSCLRPSTPDEHEMADAFVAANRKSHLWEQKFEIPQGYQLLSAVQTSQALACLAAPRRDAGPCQPWQNLRHVRFLGNPGFDSAHTHALVSIIRKCGRYCGAGGLFVVEKAGATWKRSDPTPFTENCSWMFQR